MNAIAEERKRKMLAPTMFKESAGADAAEAADILRDAHGMKRVVVIMEKPDGSFTLDCGYAVAEDPAEELCRLLNAAALRARECYQKLGGS